MKITDTAWKKDNNCSSNRGDRKMKRHQATEGRTIVRRGLTACGAAFILCATAACSDVKVLNTPNAAAAASPGNTAATQLTVGPYSTKAVVMVTADGRSIYAALPMRPSGIVVSIREASTLRAQDDSFEFHSLRQLFRSAASYNFVLPAGQTRVIQARTDPLGSGGSFNQATSIRMTAIALKAS
jgi:hypothetical protein